MFEQSMVEVRGLAARPWTLAVSVTGQVALVSIAVLIPLVHPEVLQRVAVWVPIGPPPARHASVVQKADTTRVVTARRVFRPDALFAPAIVPEKINMIQDEAEPAIADAGAGRGGVVGGIDFSRITAGVIKDVSEFQPPVRHVAPAAVVKDTPPPTPQPKQVRQGGDVQAALLIYGPKPAYPVLAKQARIAGTIHLAAVIGRDGRILDLRAMDGHPLLVGAAIGAVKQWVYRPTTLNGEPVEVVTEITVTFTLQ